MTTERTLRKLFEYQRFENEKNLQRLVEAAHARYRLVELSDDEAELVAAAGNPEMSRSKPDPTVSDT